MSAQQIAIHDAIVGIKRALSRPKNGLLSEETIAEQTNRGHKLKRKAEFVRQGRLDNPDGPATFRMKIVHAGHSRDVQYLNPPKYDIDGDLIEHWGDEEDEEEDEDDSSFIEDDNIYKDIKLEKLLAPLTSADGLPTHPSLSAPYKSHALTEMVNQAEQFLHQQQRLLWKMKQILVTMRGDSGWIPLGAVQTPYTNWLLEAGMDEGPELEGYTYRECLSTRPPAGMGSGVTTTTTTRQKGSAATGSVKDTENSCLDHGGGEHGVGQPWLNGDSKPTDSEMTNGKPGGDGAILSKKTTSTREPFLSSAKTEAPEVNGTRAPPSNSGPDYQAQQQARQDPSTALHPPSAHLSPPPGPPSFDTKDGTHPIFTFSQSCIPGYDAFLPSKEADDARAFLISYVSKQEEIVRNARKLHEGLLRAKLMGSTVWSWCRAEGHLSEMSDGEDWYDKEEWGLNEDLVKGEEEEEEVTSQKKPRRRGEKT